MTDLSSANLPLLIRADADAQMGTGHLMRCLALAQAWQAQGGKAIFITACDSVGLLQRLRDEEFRVVELEKTYPEPGEWDVTSQVLVANPDAWVVLDGYHFDPAYQQRIKEAGHPLLVIDDMAHLDHYYADVILNQNIHAAQLDYSCEPDTRLLLGTDYVLLRREFWPWREWEREIPDVARKVLVTLGGGDPDNQTFKVIQALQEVDVEGFEAVVVVGGSNPHWQALQSAAQNVPGIRLVRNVSNMPELMAWADMAITAGGSTCWETAFMGLPSMVLILAENQSAVAKGLGKYGAAANLGRCARVDESSLASVLADNVWDPVRRKTMSERARNLVDGIGVERITTNLHTSATNDHLVLRPADWDDVELLWRWANDPAVRENSFHSEPITEREHIDWYKTKLMSPNTCVWILECDQIPVAQIRYDRVEGESAEIDFSVAHDYRGRGLGTRLLILTYNIACHNLNVDRLKGVVFSQNLASSHAFIKAGFRCVDRALIIDGRRCDIYVRSCREISGGVENVTVH